MSQRDSQSTPLSSKKEILKEVAMRALASGPTIRLTLQEVETIHAVADELERLTRESEAWGKASLVAIIAERDRLREALQTSLRCLQAALGPGFKVEPLPQDSPSETYGWQPIENAPKDGRTLLLGYYNACGKWRTLRGQWFARAEIDEWENGESCDEGWYETSVEADDIPSCWATEPTHWQPTPQPPLKAGERCRARWEVANGVNIYCALPAGHEGKHQPPEPFSNESPV